MKREGPVARRSVSGGVGTEEPGYTVGKVHGSR
jgi:hypothetical protein